MKQIISILAIAAMAATSCNRANSKEKAAAAIAQQLSFDSMEKEMTRQHVVDSMNTATATAAAAKAQRANSAPRTRTVYVNGSSQPATVVAEQPATEKE